MDTGTIPDQRLLDTGTIPDQRSIEMPGRWGPARAPARVRPSRPLSGAIVPALPEVLIPVAIRRSLAHSIQQVPESILMKRLVLMAAVAGTATLSACGGSEVVVQVYTEQEGQPVPVSGLEVRALPYDRDAIFDSLRAAYTTAEPEVPADLTQLRDSIAAANQEWSRMNARWAEGRDSLRTLLDEMNAIPRMNPRYLPMFNRYNALDREVRAAEQQAGAAFARFEALNDRYATRAEETSLAREQWADAAYADVDRVIDARLRELRLQPAIGHDGREWIAASAVSSGEWWIHARYDLPFEELYWNVPVRSRGEQVDVELTRQTAEVRPKL
jgi:hypothetical protein